MKILLIGGTGNISTACTHLALEKGHEVIHFNRGNQTFASHKNLTTINGDRSNLNDWKKLEAFQSFDVVADFIAFTPEQVEWDLNFFKNITNQYIFISSATVYQKPPKHYLIKESTPLENPFWDYADNKIKCENLIRKKAAECGLPYTILRPSYTYGNTWIPTAFTAREYNPVYRMRKNLPIVVQGDGESLWVMTHNTDFAKAFVGILGNPEAMNTEFHITSDEVLTWNQIYETIGSCIGINPKIIHIPSDYIAAFEPEWGSALLGDKARSVVFDNQKIKKVLPDWKAEIDFAEGIARSIQWFEELPERMVVNQEVETKINHLIQRFTQL